MLRNILSCVFAFSLLLVSSLASAASAPSEIKIGTLYAASGSYASISMPVYMGLKMWVKSVNAEGGVMVKPYGKRIPVKLVSYDDQSSTATAATLYTQLITQDKVDILLADSGSVLTSVAVPIAREHKMLLIDQSGTGRTFFSPDNPYIALVSTPYTNAWARNLGDFMTKVGPTLGIKRVALIYATNDFASQQADALREAMTKAGAPEIVYDKGVPTDTSNYTVLLNGIRAKQPDAVLEVGYPGNDTAFLRNLSGLGLHFKFLFAVYPGLETSHMLKTVGLDGMKYVFTHIPAYKVEHKVTTGMTTAEYHKAWDKAYPNTSVSFGFNSVVGYNTGLVIEKALAETKSLDQLDLRKALFSLSGRLSTLAGTFELNKEGAQIGELMPLGQLVPDNKGGLKTVVVYPSKLATGEPIYPAPTH